MAHHDKIRDLDKLAGVLKQLRGKGKKIVHCHGVFDLLHIGHIRHFKEAKSFGDVLVVTVTEDKHVNKGPGRPVFGQQLRAEVIAALDTVDFVAVNRWPTAVETIKLLKPNFYVKGPDYGDAEKDRTGGIKLEEEAVKSVGGEIVFTKDITFSSSRIINEHVSPFPEQVQDHLADFKRKYRTDEVIGYLEDLRKLKALVIGETIIDEYQYCQAIGKSSKEPTLVVKNLSSQKFAGGILAVANHIANFAGSVAVVTQLGTFNSQEDFIGEKLNPNVKRQFLYREGSPTIVKRRYIESYFFNKLFEVYEYDDERLGHGDNKRLCELLEKEIPGYDVVVVVDYGHSMITREAVEIICGKSGFLAVNAQANAGNLGYNRISKYPKADYVCTAEKEIRLEASDHRSDLRDLIEEMVQYLDYEQINVTRGSHGSLCYSSEAGFIEAPALATKVIDRVGAGDALLSVTSLCAALGAPLEIIGFVGNAVGAQAVAMVGNEAPIERLSLIRHIETLLK